MKKLKIIILASIILIISILFATMKQEENYHFAYYIDGKKLNNMPKRDDDAKFDHGDCDYDATVTWDEERWGPIISNLTKVETKCQLYFIEKHVPSAVEYITELAKKDTVNLKTDDTRDANIRYVGANVNNYIDIGNKDSNGNPILWRIIGVMNNITNLDKGGQQESLVKIIRADSIGNYSWDSSPEEINEGFGINEWSQADLMKLLNPNTVYGEKPTIGGSLYWNRENGNCYYSTNEHSTLCNFLSNGLSEDAKKKITKVRWNTGTFAIGDDTQWTASATYEAERSSHNGKEQCVSNENDGCNDTVDRTTTWDGYLGLIYPSDSHLESHKL